MGRLLIVVVLLGLAFEGSKADCNLGDDFKFELTPCDSQGGRWRVQVPTSSDQFQSCSLQQPKRVDSCESSCAAGQFFDLSSLSCSPCSAGTYSLGGAVLFDSWDTLPEGFHSQVESFQSSFIGRYGNGINCTAYGWQAKGDFLASLGGPCAATVAVSVRLASAGNLSYWYQYSNRDVIFDFEAQNEQCQSVADAKEYRWPSATAEGEWHRQVVQLKPGNNLLQWKTIGMETYPGKPVLIKSIEISGMAKSPSCTPCRNGTFSSSGSRKCQECPENHFSVRGASSCQPCNPETEFSPKGYPRCLKRHVCTSKDFYEAKSPCDANNQTRTVYRWLEPKICMAGVELPQPGPKHPCMPCNPGMRQASSTGATAGATSCEFCPVEHFSEDGGQCKTCPPNTTPNYGYMFERWAEMPAMMSSTCRQQDGAECGGMAGWQLAGSHIHSGRHHADGAYLLLSLNVPGFRGKGSVVGGRRLEVGRVAFTFELDCKAKCEFVFMESSDRQGMTLVQSWSGATSKHEFSHPVYTNDSYTFSWAFQKASLSDFDILSNLLDADVARIFSINVTNTIDGGASVCLPCHQETEELGCIPCPPGQYVDPNSTQCTPCPPGTTVSDPLAYGIESCQPCGPGLSSVDGVTCTSDCVFQGDPSFDLSALADTVLIRGSRLFTASGAQYYHVFNISLCGKIQAQCSNNVSYQMDGQTSQINSFVCRTTMVPSAWSEEEVILSTQSVTLGDELVAVTKDTTFMNMEVIEEFLTANTSLHFYYTTPMATRSCPQGRTTVISLMCDPSKRGNGTIVLPSKCPDGTCDGCTFNFLWQTAVACPVCKEKDYKLVKGECTLGSQLLHYLAPTNCRVLGDLPATKAVKCQNHIPVELQAIIGGTVMVAALLCGLMVHFWRKTQRLEYKYMKLVQNSTSGSDGAELPPAESCALDDGEEEDVHFAQPAKQNFLNRIKAMTRKSEGDSSAFETIQLTQ
ncbi:endosome/lysosome-associated apoptosis and autophagy regulator family member 2-like isoform X2 [Neocloeon triangulifer]|uniref:endosome/lysosome-associated apoptosis and autophagy regulator family member 2-like isoform X2 n=1 Tax=Neocloeon triangulifer TaxID=2078957 RepID=UPI00286EB61E|nr:endosome/lysosome-associated apoptosis and autophagy regulator family member 2-like isoform X2 [Neocloeon triangulifer]